jgi:hypothetical protein
MSDGMAVLDAAAVALLLSGMAVAGALLLGALVRQWLKRKDQR